MLIVYSQVINFPSNFLRILWNIEDESNTSLNVSRKFQENFSGDDLDKSHKPSDKLTRVGVNLMLPILFKLSQLFSLKSQAEATREFSVS